MSQENVDLVKESFDAWNRRDLEALLEVNDPKEGRATIFVMIATHTGPEQQ